jgi:hypothetical protein
LSKAASLRSLRARLTASRLMYPTKDVSMPKQKMQQSRMKIEQEDGR